MLNEGRNTTFHRNLDKNLEYQDAHITISVLSYKHTEDKKNIQLEESSRAEARLLADLSSMFLPVPLQIGFQTANNSMGLFSCLWGQLISKVSFNHLQLFQGTELAFPTALTHPKLYSELNSSSS